MGYRLKVEIEYLIALGNEKTIKELPAFSKEEQSRLRKICQNFNTAGAEKVKQIEATTTTTTTITTIAVGADRGQQ